MKKHFIILIAVVVFSCKENFLDKNPLDKVSNETFWNNEKDALAAAAGCYSDWWSMSNVLYFDCNSDNAYDPFSWESVNMAKGVSTPGTQHLTNYFDFASITKYNNFLDNISRPTMNEKLRTRLKAEVRFLRAWEYFIITTLYGDVPLITKVLKLTEAKVERSPKAEVVKFIIDELTAIVPDLEQSYSGSDVGRITKGAALSVKARMLLFDGQFDACATTCRQIMTLGYELHPSYKELFKEAHERNKEVVLGVEYIEDLYSNGTLGVLPPASSGGWCSINSTHELIEDYECSDGKTITQSPLYDPAEPYKNRDPRLEVSIIYPGALYEGKYYDPIDKASSDYYSPYGNSKTGYLVRKYVDNLSDYKDMWNAGTNAMVIRYAEILLMYAEAMMEAGTIDGTVYDAIDAVRVRAGMPKVDKAVYNNQTTLRELIRRERRVELAMEGIRWFDICRWKIGPQVLNRNVYGALLGKVSQKDGALTLGTDRIFVETRVFDPAKNYLWPIPQSVIDATAPAIKQNPNY